MIVLRDMVKLAPPRCHLPDAALVALRLAWQFQKNLRDAYVWHRSTGARATRALFCAWRTALLLMATHPEPVARSPMGATLSFLARKIPTDVANRGHWRSSIYGAAPPFLVNCHLRVLRGTPSLVRRLVSSLSHSGQSATSDDLIWKPVAPSRLQASAVPLLLAFAVLVVFAGTLYPLQLVTNVTAISVGARLPAAKGAPTRLLNPSTARSTTPHELITEAPLRRRGVNGSYSEGQRPAPIMRPRERMSPRG